MSHFTEKTWLVERDSTVGLVEGDELIFVDPGAGGIRVNENDHWGDDCQYTGDTTATVTRDQKTYSLVISDGRLTCTLLSTTAAPSPSSFPLLGSDHPWPSHSARRKVRAKSKRESECEFPVLGDPPPSSWTAIEGGGGGQP